MFRSINLDSIKIGKQCRWLNIPDKRLQVKRTLREAVNLAYGNEKNAFESLCLNEHGKETTISHLRKNTKTGKTINGPGFEAYLMLYEK